MPLTLQELAALNNGKKPIDSNAERWAVYEQARKEYDAVHGKLEVHEHPPSSVPRLNESRLNSAAEWNLETNALPSETSVIVVSGGSGVSASKQAGVAAGLASEGNVAKVVVSSGGCIAWIPAVLGMSAKDMRAMNAGAPSQSFLQPIEDLKAIDKLSFAGTHNMEPLNEWFDQWMEWSGKPTFGDNRFPEGHPHTVAGPYRDKSGDWQKRPDDPYRISIGLTVYDLQGDFPCLTQAQLDDPKVARSIIKHAFDIEKPFGKMRQRFFPNDVEAEFPWMTDSVDSTKISEVTDWSCRRWPYAVPKLLQDPSTLRIKMVFDGATLNTHPDLWMTGHMPTWTTDDPAQILVVRGKQADRRFMPQSTIDSKERPWHTNVRTKASGFGPLEIDRLTIEERDAMFIAGSIEGEEVVRSLEGAMGRNIDNVLERADDTGRIDAHPPLHGANLMFEDRSTRPSDAGRQLGW